MIIIKQHRDMPIYVEWSTIADGPGRVVYSREEALSYLGATEDQLQRADETGTSSYSEEGPGPGAWDDEGLIAEQRWLPRNAILRYALSFPDEEKMKELTQECG